MQTRQRILSSSLAILIATPAFICNRASAANRWWDGGTTDIAGNGNAASTGGTGTWNTTLLNWDAGAAPHVSWNNAGNDTAIFGGTAGTVTLGVPIGISNITFSAGSLGTSQYTITGSTLNLTSGGLIANLNGTSGKIQTISSAITGAPNVNLITSSVGNDITGGLKFAPTGAAVQNLGTVTLAAGYPGSTGGADKTTLTLGGTTTGNTLQTVNQNTNYSLIRKNESGSWTVTGVAKFGRLYMDGGNLIVTGTLQGTQYQGPYLNSGTLHYNSPAAVYTGTNFTNSTVFIFNGGSLDQTSGAPITTSTHNPYMDWRANVTFIGSNGANSNLNLGNGAVRLTGNRTVTVQNSATTLTVGGAISGTGFGLTKAGPGKLLLTGNNTYNGATMVNEGTLALSGGGTVSALTVNAASILELPLGSPVNSTAGLDFVAGSKVRIIGTPTVPSYTLFTTSGIISGTPVLESPITDYELFIENGNTLKLSKNTDTDEDGLPDWWEQLYTQPPSTTGLNPATDLEPDGLTNLQEFERGTNPIIADTDDDGLLDGVETNTGTYASTSNTGTDPLKSDTDGDGLPDGVETHTGVWVSASNTGTSPFLRDTDGDSYPDNVETNTGIYVSAGNTGTNPVKADTDGDGAGDWYEITASFTSPFNAASNPGIPYPLPAPDNSPGASNKPVKVYIMSGQSNMVGFGTINGSVSGTLETYVKTDGRFPNLVTAGGAWATRKDVRYRGVISAIGNADLAPGFGADSGKIGPELGFGHVMGWYHDAPVLLIKSSIGNRSLGWDVLPPGSPSYVYGSTNYGGYGDWGNWPVGENPPTSGTWYAGKEFDRYFMDESDWAHPDTAATNVVDILDNWATEYSATNKPFAGQDFQIAGFVWWQGDKDRYDMGHATRYEQNLVNLITSLRNYYTNRYPGKVVANAPFVLATLGQTPLESTNAAEKAILDGMLAVDGEVGKYPQFAGNVKTVYAHPLSEGGASNSHYNGRAGTYLLVGDALGRAMVGLLDAGTQPGGDYAVWAAGFPGTDLSDPDDDFDNDGMNNNEERIWGLDPTHGASSNPISVPFDATAGTFSYTRRNPALNTGLAYSYQWSDMLAEDSWEPFTPGNVAASGTSPVETVTITLPASLLGEPKAFVRVVANPE